MLFSVGDVITFAVVLLLLVIFRAADRNNRSIEKLKRFGDKVMEGLGTFVEERTGEMRRLTTDLAASMKDGAEVLRRSQAVEEDLASRAGEVASLQKRLADLDSSLHGLAEASGRADQEVKRLREQSAWVEEVNRRVAATASRLDAVEASARQLAEKLAAQGRAALESVREEVVGAVSERVAGLTEQVSAAEAGSKDLAAFVARLQASAAAVEQDRAASARNALEGFDAEIGARLAAAIEGAAGFEEEVFSKLRQAIEGHEAEAQQGLDRVARSLADHEADLDYRMRRLEESAPDPAALVATLHAAVEQAAAASREELTSLGRTLSEEWQREIAATAEEKARLAAGITELSGGLDALKAKAYQDVTDKLKLFEDAFFADLRSRSTAMQEKLGAWQAAEAAAIEGRVAELERAVAERAAASEAAVAGLRDSLRSEIERARGDAAGVFEKEMASLRDAVEGASRKIHREVEGISAEAESAVAAVRDELAAQKEETAAAWATERTAVRSEIGEFRGDLEEHRQKVEALQQRMLARLDESQRALSAQVTETERRVKSFQGQTRLFERADTMRAGLESDIAELKKELARLASEKAEVSELEAQLGRTRKVAEEVSGKLARFLAEKRRVEELEEDFKRVLGLSRDVDLKLDSLGQTGDTIQQLQARVRQFEEMGRTVETGFQRLEQKREIIEVTAEGVDRTFQRLEALEKSLAAAGRDLEGMGQRTDSLKGELETLAGSRQSAEAAMAIVGKLDGITVELEQRLEKAQNAREWLARTETRFEEITRQAAEQVRLLESIVKAETKREKGERGAPSGENRDIVVKLAHQGWSVQEISRVTKLSRGEVELILELAPKS